MVPFSPSVSPHSAHLFVCPDLTPDDPLTNNPHVLATCPIVLLSKQCVCVIAMICLYAHSWELLNKITQLCRPILQSTCVSVVTLLHHRITLASFFRKPGYMTALNFEPLPSPPHKPFLVPFSRSQRPPSSYSGPAFSACVHVSLWSDFSLSLITSLHSVSYPSKPNHAVPNS